MPLADLEAELQDAVNERAIIVNNEIGGYEEEAMCVKMANVVLCLLHAHQLFTALTSFPDLRCT